MKIYDANKSREFAVIRELFKLENFDDAHWLTDFRIKKNFYV